MSIVQLLFGILIGLFVFSAISGLLFLSAGINRKLNGLYAGFALALAFHFLFAGCFLFALDVETYIFYEKLYVGAILVAGAILLELIPELTWYKASKIRYTIQVLLFVLLVLHYYLPYGIAFSEVYGIRSEVLFAGEKVTLIRAEVSEYIYFALTVFLLILFYIVQATSHLMNLGKEKMAKLFFLAFCLILGGMMVDSLLGDNSLPGISIVKNFTFIGIGAFAMYLNTLTLRERIPDSVRIPISPVQNERVVTAILDSLPITLLIVGKDFSILKANRFAAKKAPFSPERLPIEVCFPYLKEFVGELKESHSQEIVRRTIVDSSSPPDPSYYEVTVVPFSIDLKTSFSNRMQKVEPELLVIIEDTTLKERSEQQKLEEGYLRIISGISAGMAHEINSPLAAITQGTENLLRRMNPENAKNQEVASHYSLDLNALGNYFQERELFEIIRFIRESANRAAGITRGLLHFTNFNKANNESYPVKNAIDDALTMLKNDFFLTTLANFNEIVFTVTVEDQLPDLQSSAGDIQLVLYNILNNAAYSLLIGNPRRVPPIVTISARMENELFLITIADNGPGMHPNVVKRVFEPFFTTKPVGQGSGLGLSISYMVIAQNYKGTIRVESEWNKGAAFTISIPVN